jgi:tetratricopeptide (TPR) repeat protein
MQDEILALRVAARFHREAAFIPAKWFKERSAELKAILKKPLDSDSTQYWPTPLQEDVLGFFDRFQEDFLKMAPPVQEIREAVELRVKGVKSYLAKVYEDLFKLTSYLHRYFNWDDPKEYVTWRAKNAIDRQMREKAKVVGDLLKVHWSVDEAKIEALVQKALKGASPEQLAALVDQSGRSDAGYYYLQRIGFEASALKLLKKERLTPGFFEWRPDWVDHLYKMLEANYSEQAFADQGVFREFDLYGMKIVIDDSTVNPQEIKKYIKYLDEAYARMKSKGFAKAWYGTVFIRCKECGGPNPYSSRGTGGDYDIRPDTVQIYSRPGPFIVELMAHELGHRYWFKQMTSAQRARFSDLVKTHTVYPPTRAEVQKYSEKEFPGIKKRVLEEQQEVEDYLVRIERAIAQDDGSDRRWKRRAFETLENVGEYILSSIRNRLEENKFAKPVLDNLGPEVEGLQSKLSQSLQVLKGRRGTLDNVLAYSPSLTSRWVTDIRALLGEVVDSALAYAQAAIETANEKIQEAIDNDPQLKEWLESYEKNPNPVLPVSDYGKSNVGEAFAEVFMKYVVEEDMTRDQLESFKSVISTDDPLVALLVQRYLSGVAPRDAQGPLS